MLKKITYVFQDNFQIDLAVYLLLHSILVFELRILRIFNAPQTELPLLKHIEFYLLHMHDLRNDGDAIQLEKQLFLSRNLCKSFSTSLMIFESSEIGLYLLETCWSPSLKTEITFTIFIEFGNISHISVLSHILSHTSVV